MRRPSPLPSLLLYYCDLVAEKAAPRSISASARPNRPTASLSWPPKSRRQRRSERPAPAAIARSRLRAIASGELNLARQADHQDQFLAPSRLRPAREAV